jgi:adenylate cyclase class 2
MPKEYEYPFLLFDKQKIIKKIKEKEGTYIGTYLFRVQVFSHPLEKKLTYIRIRDEGVKITMTYKYKKSELEKFPTEHEVIIDDFDEMFNILIGLGCKKMHYYEKIREIWKLGTSEIVFDNYPMLPELMEIECEKKSTLDKLVKIFNLTIEDKNIIKESNVINLYGFDYIKNLDTTFNNVKKYKKLVTNNKKKFNDIVKKQMEIYLLIQKK